MTSAVTQWFVPSADEAARCMNAAAAVGSESYNAVLDTLSWALYGGCAPISGQRIAPGVDTARVELAAAVHVARTGLPPTVDEWWGFGIDNPPRITSGDTPDWARGAASALRWLLGDEDHPPIG